MKDRSHLPWVIGASGFIGKNLVVRLGKDKCKTWNPSSCSVQLLKQLLAVHKGDTYYVAGATANATEEDYQRDLELLALTLAQVSPGRRFVYASSVKHGDGSRYGYHKADIEKLIRRVQPQASIVRLPNVFGKWAKPNHNSIVATWCHEIVNGLPTTPITKDDEIEWLHIDEALDNLVDGKNKKGTPELPSIVLQDLKRAWKKPNFGFRYYWNAKFASTLWSYTKPQTKIPTHIDERGCFGEFTKNAMGQTSYITTEEGQVRGNHWHENRLEKFVLHRPTDILTCEHVLTKERRYYEGGLVKPTEVFVPPGWAHKLENQARRSSLTLLWSSDVYNPQKPDTIKYEL